MKKLIWLGCLSYLVIGMAHVVAGSVLEPLLDHYGLDYRDGGQWIMNQFLGFLFGVLATPYIIRMLGRRNTLLVALGTLTAAEAAYSLLLPWGWMLGFGPVAGFGFGLTEAVLGAIIIEFVTEGKASAMTRLETFFGLGALAMPAIAGVLIANQVWQMAFPVVTAVSGITTLLWLTLSFGKADDMLAYDPIARAAGRTGSGAPPKPRYVRASLPVLAIGMLYFALYVGMEMSFSNYLPSILKERMGMEEAAAASSLSIFWGMMVVGRIFSGRVAEWSGYFRYLLVSSAVGTGFLVLLAMTGHEVTGLIWTGLSGLFWSGVFAIGLLYVNGKLPGMTERTTSYLVAAGGLGGALLPKATGWFMDSYGAVGTLWMIAGAAAMLIVLLGAMAAASRKVQPMEGGR
jgi:MFS transporter, FHS family, glucose/mannose:H+ symporter